jgi:hypothetical protein
MFRYKITKQNQADGLEKMIKVGIKPHLEAEIVRPVNMQTMLSPNRQLHLNPNFNLINDNNNKDLGISHKFLVSTESHKDEHSMLRLLNGEISSNERSTKHSGNFKKEKQPKKKRKKKSKEETKKGKKKKNK